MTFSQRTNCRSRHALLSGMHNVLNSARMTISTPCEHWPCPPGWGVPEKSMNSLPVKAGQNGKRRRQERGNEFPLSVSLSPVAPMHHGPVPRGRPARDLGSGCSPDIRPGTAPVHRRKRPGWGCRRNIQNPGSARDRRGGTRSPSPPTPHQDHATGHKNGSFISPGGA